MDTTVFKKIIKNQWFTVIALIIFNFAIYSHLIGHFFYSDDFVWLYYGELINEDILNTFKLHVTSFFSPVVNAYFGFGQAVFPFNAKAFHILGILIHAVNVVLVYFLALKITKHRIASLIAALFFSFAEYHYEAVIWISAIMHVLVSSFVLLGLLAYTKFRESKKYTYILLSILAGLLAFFAKENGIVFVPLVVGLYLYFEDRSFWRFKNWRHLLPYAALLLFVLGYTYLNQRNSMWIENGIYNIHIKALYPLLASFFALFDMDSAKYLIARPKIFLASFLALLSFFVLVFRKNQKEAKLFLLGCYMALVSFTPVMFFYFGTWREISQNRYSYLPALGAALVFSSFALLIKKKFGYNKVVISLALVVFCLYGLFQISSFIKFYNGEYDYIDQQMRGMEMSFDLLEEKLTDHKNIILTGHYPFGGNEYYRYMYRYFTDPNMNKSVDDWSSMIDYHQAIEKFGSDPKYLLLGWDDLEKEIYIIPTKE